MWSSPVLDLTLFLLPFLFLSSLTPLESFALLKSVEGSGLFGHLDLSSK